MTMMHVGFGRAALACGAAAVALAMAQGSARADALESARARVVPPPMTVPTAKYFSAHPDAYARFLARLPARAALERSDVSPPFTTSAGGHWNVVATAPNGLSNPVLLTDGTVIAAAGDTPYWYKLTPDSAGDYAKGTWTQIASLPVINGAQYAPLYHSTGVLPDGRVIIMGGEYNNSNSGVWTNEGAIYDPVANTWTSVNPPLGTPWTQIGDSQSVMLANGKFMQASCCAYPAADAILNAKTLTWQTAAAPTLGGNYQDEQGYTLLPSGNVLTIDIWTAYPSGAATNAELYNVATHSWIAAGNTPVSLPDPPACGNWEIGPAPLRGDGTVVAFGGNTGCVAGATADPIAIYDSNAGTWTAGPNVPAVCGSDGATSCSLADAPAAVLPNGNILFAASSGYGDNPTHFFEFTPANTIIQVSDEKLHAAQAGAYYYNFLVLPNGQILSTDFSKNAEVYTPAGAAVGAWAPYINRVAKILTAGKTYALAGGQLSGVTQGGYYGDDYQASTNFPLVRLTNSASGTVTYARTTKISTMSVAPGTAGTTDFTVPAGTPTGASSLQVIANGIASSPIEVLVK